MTTAQCRSLPTRSIGAEASPPGASWRGGGRPFVVVLMVVFCTAGLVKVLHHDMWRDEWQAWMMCSQSSSLAELNANVRYQGHPRLWFLCLYLLSRFTSDPVAMKVFHLTAAASLVFVVARYSPFGRLNKILFAFGYFPFFEYATISRCYGLGFLLVAVACMLMGRRRVNALVLALVLALLAQTSIYGICLALALGVTCAFQVVLRGPSTPAPCARRWQTAIPFLIVLAAVGVAIVSLFPMPRGSVSDEWRNTTHLDRLGKTISIVWRAWVPLPEMKPHFWNSNVLDAFPRIEVGASAVLIVAAVLLFARRPAALVMLLLGSGGVLSFSYLKYPGFLRHHGHLYISLVAAYYLSYSCDAMGAWPPFLARLTCWFDRCRQGTMTTILFVHVVAGVGASAADLFIPFTAAREASRYIQDRFDTSIPIVGHYDHCVSSVSGYLNRQVYYPSMKKFGTFIVQDSARVWDLSAQDVIIQAAALMVEGRTNRVLLVISSGMRFPDDKSQGVLRGASTTPVLRFRWRLVATFEQSIVGDETYAVYLMERLPG